jgi:hypothetical protein
MQATKTEFLSLAAAAAWAGVHPTTVSRWAKRGAKIDGVYYRLKGVRFPGGWRTTKQDLDAYVARLTALSLGEPDPSGPPDPPKVRSSAADRGRSRRVDNELDRLGIRPPSGPQDADADMGLEGAT